MSPESITDAKRLRADLETHVLVLLQNFETATGLKVEKVELVELRRAVSRHADLHAVRIDVSL